MNFASDNTAGAAPRVLEALVEANHGPAPAYGDDPWTRRAQLLLNEIFEREVTPFLVSTGTAANALALSCFTPPWGAVLSHHESHIMGNECGAVESFSGGAKLIGLDGKGMKISPDTLTAAAGSPVRGVHSVQPKTFSFSQATEAGTVYRPEEIRALAEEAHAHGLAVHMDGARFANAVAATGASPAELSWKAGVDVLSLGLTKTGGLAAEAVILFDARAAEELAFRRKRQGQLLSKGRLFGAQFSTMLDQGYWLDLARHANAMASRLAAGCQGRVRLAAPVEANEIFPVLPRPVADRLRAAGATFHEWPSPQLAADADVGTEEIIIRLVASWATTTDDVDDFLAALHEATVPVG